MGKKKAFYYKFSMVYISPKSNGYFSKVLTLLGFAFSCQLWGWKEFVLQFVVFLNTFLFPVAQLWKRRIIYTEQWDSTVWSCSLRDAVKLCLPTDTCVSFQINFTACGDTLVLLLLFPDIQS